MPAMKEALQGLKKGLGLFEKPEIVVSFANQSSLPQFEKITAISNESIKRESSFGDVSDIPDLQQSSDVLLPIFQNGQTVNGSIDILFNNQPPKPKQLEYTEISVYLIGQLLCPQINKELVFTHQKVSLADMPGILRKNTQFEFAFKNPQMDRDSFYGSLVTIRYYIRVNINRPGVLSSMIEENKEFVVINIQPNNLKSIAKPRPADMQVGVDQCLHINFHYENVNLDINGVLSGNVSILSNSLRITTMQIQMLRREVIKTGLDSNPEIVNTEVLGKYEIMDGYPGDGETIPVRMPLGRFKKLGATQKDKQFSVRYYANLGLIDRDGRRYFKTVELKLWRKSLQ